jgi:uncharacterized protein YPO0396
MKKSRGYRLERFEVLNWGTFHSSVWSLELNGGTALLVGANGSGKSTLVDAFLTLLVPSRARHYNQASGDTARRERSEASYVRGAFKRTSSESENTSSVQYLRDKDNYSVILACFTESQETVCLATVFYWGNNTQPEHFYVVAAKPLKIAEDFVFESDISSFKKRLRQQGAVLFDDFKKYSLEFMKRLNLRSEKALDLFNKTVSIKEITELNDFVRSHMLEKPNSQEKIDNLLLQFQDLNKAHDAILKAQAQIDVLAPMQQQYLEFERLQEKILLAEQSAEASKYYFAHQRLGLHQTQIQQSQTRLLQLETEAQQLDFQLEQLGQEEFHLRQAIEQNEIGRRLSDLQRNCENQEHMAQERQRKQQRFLEVTSKLKLGVISNQGELTKLHASAQNNIQILEQQQQERQTELDELRVEIRDFEKKLKDLKTEIESLESRKSNIPRDNLRIREQILSALGLSEETLPFAGELIQVKNSQKQWEGAIERLLSPLGRQLLVPEPQYARVSDYVNRTNLRGRLVYLRTLPNRRSVSEPEPNMLIEKLELQPNHPMQSWLKNELIQRWDYVCCDNLEQFKLERRALSLQGQIKHNENRHEKDDSKSLGDARDFVLGWSNQEKIQALRNEFSDLASNSSIAQAEIRNLEQQRSILTEQIQSWQNLREYQIFEELDPMPALEKLEEMKAQILQLSQESSQLAALKTQLEQCRENQQIRTKERRELEREHGALEQSLKQHQQQEHKQKTLLNTIQLEAWQPLVQHIEPELRGRELNLENVDDLEKTIFDTLLRRAKSFLGQANTLQTSIEKTMQDFRNRFPTDSTEMDSTIGSMPDYQRLLGRLEHDDLPQYREQFKKWLDDKISLAIKSFQTSLENQDEDIVRSIKDLNTALEQINYTTSTYIQLEAKKNTDAEVSAFRQLLRACTPDHGQLQNNELREANFMQIKNLIERFSTDSKWTNKVTDVRQWRVFAARERYRETHEEKNYYEGSSGKSGGQKAKLAYTILASAIAYQYQLEPGKHNAKTFRFVVVDEAFSKSDEINSRYAMELFEKLDLQLLVVTPKDKTHVVESFIQSCHFVINSPEEDNSQVYTLTQQQFEQQKRRWANELS